MAGRGRPAGGKIVALAGGVGAARFLDGLARIVPPARLVVIGNVGDDAVIHGLHISPDLDTVMYTLAGISHRVQGWGLQGDTFHCLDALGRLGAENWFRLGDRDLATHIYRTARLRAGVPLSLVTRELAAALGVHSALVPVTDDCLRTEVLTRHGALEFQTWFVQRRARDQVTGVRFAGARNARPASGILELLAAADGVILCPSNPFISIAPILAVRGVREALRKTPAPVAAISPIVAGRALKGPAARMMKSMGIGASAAAVAGMYRDFVNIFVLDHADHRQAAKIQRLGMRPVVTGTVMTGLRTKKALAAAVLSAMGVA
ncbi:MAG: 2-phospho-L-lactate transferase [Bryobacteraceae bacterium]